MIITENEKSKVVFSSLFFRHYPALSEELCKIMWNYHKGYGAVFHTKDYWVRDFMPIQIDKDVFVKFIYNPDYLQDKKKYITDVDKVLKRSPIAQNYKIIEVPLVVDGGNMVFCRRRLACYGVVSFVVMTEKVLVENPQYSKEEIEKIFKNAFGHIVILWLPWDREDIFGHTDGIVKFVGNEENAKLLVNLELYGDDIANQMYSRLSNIFKVVELKLSEYDELSWAYINSLQTEDFIIVPGIGNETTDAEALDQYRMLFPEYKDNIYQVQMRDFIEENGGALNCLTWTISDALTGHSKKPKNKRLEEEYREELYMV